jgi:creatinine amidohydrolase
VRSATPAFGRVVLVSTHGGNAEPVARAVARLRAEGRAVSAWWPRWDGDLHAGRTETSIVAAVAPDAVDPGRAEPGDLRPLAELLPELRRTGVRAVSPNGVLGDPAGASAAEGLELLDRAAQELVGSLAVEGDGNGQQAAAHLRPAPERAGGGR